MSVPVQKKSTQCLIARDLHLVTQHISPSLAQSHMLKNPPEHGVSPPRTFQVRQARVNTSTTRSTESPNPSAPLRNEEKYRNRVCQFLSSSNLRFSAIPLPSILRGRVICINLFLLRWREDVVISERLCSTFEICDRVYGAQETPSASFDTWLIVHSSIGSRNTRLRNSHSHVPRSQLHRRGALHRPFIEITTHVVRWLTYGIFVLA